MVKQTEKYIQTKVISRCKRAGWFCLRVSNPTKRGVSDYILFKNGRVIFLEFKSTKGKQSLHQKNFQEWCEENQFEYHLIKDPNWQPSFDKETHSGKDNHYEKD